MTLPEAFWRLRVTPGGKPAPPSVKKRVAKPTKLPKWAAAQQERASKFLKDLQVFNDDLDWIAGNAAASGGAQTVPARVMSHLWGKTSSTSSKPRRSTSPSSRGAPT